MTPPPRPARPARGSSRPTGRRTGERSRMQTTELAVRETALAPLDAQGLIEQAIAKGADMTTLERLFALAKEVQAETARREWYAAVAAFQRDCPPIKKTKTATIPTKNGGSYSYRYAPLEEILGT